MATMKGLNEEASSGVFCEMLLAPQGFPSYETMCTLVPKGWCEINTPHVSLQVVKRRL